jgi:hypothetical protein
MQARVLMGVQPCMRPLFCALRKTYKACLLSHRSAWQSVYESQLLSAAEAAPFKFGMRVGPRAVCPIPPQLMMEHFRDIAGGISSAPPPDTPSYHLALTLDQTHWAARMNDPFTQEEVQMVINSLPRGKAEGPDMLRYEHLKDSPVTTAMLVQLFNRCLGETCFPSKWRDCIMVLIPKGKGDLSSPSAWRGISKKSVLGKLLASLLSRRLLRYLTNCDLLPPEQHGFLPGRSTSTAVAALMRYIDSNLKANGSPVYAAFIDFKAAFNTASRTAIINILAQCGVSGPFLEIVNVMLAPNLIRLFDGIKLLPEFIQDTGLPQGDTIASLLFVVLLLHLPSDIRTVAPRVDPELYADDLLLLALAIAHLKSAILATRSLALELGLEINWDKTKIVKFRRAGRLSLTDVMVIDGFTIPFVPAFVYLGVTFTVTASTFSRHVQDRRAKAIAAIRLLPSPRLLSLNAALGLFRCKIAPMAYYAIPQVWKHLKVADFRAIDGVQMCFLKRVLGVSKYTRSRLVTLLTGVTHTTQSLALTFDLPVTPAYRAYLDENQQKLAEVDQAFFSTSAMLDRGWARPLSTVRSTLCRFAIHGFHHQFCTMETFHEPSPSCTCRHCGAVCQRYHFHHCLVPPVSSILGFV